MARLAVANALCAEGGDTVGRGIDRHTLCLCLRHAAIAIPAAFLARDQISCGLLRGEQTIALALFGATLALLVAFGDRAGGLTFGSTPVGPPAVITLLAVILRRVLCGGASSADFATDEAVISGAVWGRAKGGAYGTAGGA